MNRVGKMPKIIFLQASTFPALCLKVSCDVMKVKQKDQTDGLRRTDKIKFKGLSQSEEKKINYSQNLNLNTDLQHQYLTR